jgi:dTDP-4-amino-4,6-dideoxygalactose transaminase
MAAQGVATEVYYPVIIPQQEIYRALGFNAILPLAEAACHEVVSLPVHPALLPGELDHIACAVSNALKAGGKT